MLHAQRPSSAPKPTSADPQALPCTFTCLSVGDCFALVAKEAFRAVMAAFSGRVVPAADAHPATFGAGQFKQLQVEAALAGVRAAVALYREKQGSVSFGGFMCHQLS